MTEHRIMTLADWGAAVRARMAERGLTPGDVEDRAQIGDNNLSKMLSGQKSLTWRRIEKVNAVVGLAFSMVLVSRDFASESQISDSVSANVGQVRNVKDPT